MKPPDWATDYAQSCRRNYTLMRGGKIDNLEIEKLIRTFRDAERDFLMLEPLLRYRKGARINPQTGCRFGASYTVNLLRECREVCEELLSVNVSSDIHIGRAVHGLAKLFREKTGKPPNFQQVGIAITEAFKDVMTKSIAEEKVARWAKQKEQRYAKLLANQTNWERAFKGFERSLLFNRFLNPPRKGIASIPVPVDHQALDSIKAQIDEKSILGQMLVAYRNSLDA
jgi:hypothetical protein